MKTPFEKYKKKRNDDWLKLKAIQQSCEHPAEYVTSENKSCDGDYYNPAEYWTDHKCNYCGSTWTTSQ